MTDTAPGLSLDFVAMLGARLGDLTDALAQERRDRAALIPNDVWPSNTGYAATGVNLPLDLGGPPPGRVWLLRGLTIGGVSWGTVAAGTAECYVSAMAAPAVAVARSLPDLFEQASALPFRAFYSSRQVALVAPARLVVVVVGGTNLQQYAASARVEEYAQRAHELQAFEL